MTVTVKLVPEQAAYDDLLQRSLSKISCDLARLIYLASTRDYNTGTYHHDGLAARFSPDVAGKALEMAHRQIFYQLSALLAGAIGRTTANLSGLFARKPCGRTAHLAKTGTLSRGDSCGSESRGCALISVQHQTRFGNLAIPSGAGSEASVSRMATAVTCPTISASLP